MTVDIEKLEALAKAATPQNFDSAEEKAENGYIECPHCGGNGEVELETDYCNYDNSAMGVQFYGIGGEFGAAEAFYRAANPAAVLELIAELKQAEEDNVTWKGGISALGEALKKLTFCARTVTDGPDHALMDACDAAENALSLVGISRAIDYVEGLEAERVQLKIENACLLEKYEAARDRERSIALLQMQRDQLLEALQEMEIGSGTSPGANKKYKKARQAIAFATGKVKS